MRLKALLDLAKIRISLLATLSTATGFLLGMERPSLSLLSSTLGIFFLACGASALNQYQERDLDARMQRTRGRPLPSGEVAPGTGLGIALVFLVLGFLVLALWTPPPAWALGALAVVWYNAVYLVLKQRTPFAAIPGALVGAIPPAVGWVSAGGRLDDPRLLALSSFFFLWQVPHFWLLLLAHKEEYEFAGLPTLTQRFGEGALKRLILCFIAATAVACLAIPFLGRRPSTFMMLLLLIANLALVAEAVRWTRSDEFSLESAFRAINLYALGVMALLSVGKLLT